MGVPVFLEDRRGVMQVSFFFPSPSGGDSIPPFPFVSEGRGEPCFLFVPGGTGG